MKRRPNQTERRPGTGPERDGGRQRPGPSGAVCARARSTFALVWLLCGPMPAPALEAGDQMQFADALFARGLYDLAAREYKALAEQPRGTHADVAAYRLGEVLRQQGRADDAHAAYAGVEARFPGSAAALRAGFRMAEGDLAAGRAEAALDRLRRLDGQDGAPEDLREAVLYYLGHAAGRLSDAAAAETAWGRLLAAAPDGAYAQLARVELAALLQATGAKPDRIRDLLEKAAAQEHSRRAAAEARLQLAELLFREKSYADSAAAYTRYRREFPDDAARERSRLPAAWAHLRAGEWDRALELAGPDEVTPDWLYLQANAHRLGGDTGAARETYQRLLNDHQSAGESGAAAYELALLYFRDGVFSNAYALARQAPETDAIRSDLLWLRAETARETGRADEALSLYDALAPLADPERATAARLQAARLRQDGGHWVDASKRYRAAAEHAVPESVAADALAASAYCRIQTQQHEEALRDWNAILKRAPGYARTDHVLAGKARTELALGRDDAAEKTLQRLLEKFPDGALAAEAMLLSGTLAEKKEAWQAAADHYANALRADGSPELKRSVQFRRVAVLQRLGRQDEAGDALNALIAGGAQADIPAVLLDWAARWNLDQSNSTAAAEAAVALARREETPAWSQIAWFLAGRAFAAGQRMDEAGAAFEKSAKAPAQTAEGVEASLRWGEWALSRKNWADARGAFDRAASAASSPELAEIRARSYFGLGRVAEGEERWADAARQYMAVALLYDDPRLSPEALESAARMFERAGDSAAAEQAKRERADRYPGAAPASAP